MGNANVTVDYKKQKEIHVGDWVETECGIRQISKVSTGCMGILSTIYMAINTDGIVTSADTSIEGLLSTYDTVKPLEVVSHELKLREI